MKIRPNAPCPCGSGRKYKKCCIYKDARQASLEEPPAQTQFLDPQLNPEQATEALLGSLDLSLRWKPFAASLDAESLSGDPEAFARHLEASQLQYLGQISALGELATLQAAQVGLERFEAIPPGDQDILYPLMLKPTLLRLLGREQEAYRYCFEKLCELRSEHLWVGYGGIVWEWLLQSEQSPAQDAEAQDAEAQDAEARDAVEASIQRGLEQLCETTDLAPPRLLLVRLLQRQGEADAGALLELQRDALHPERWRPYFKQGIGPWLGSIAHGLFLWVEDGLSREDPKERKELTSFILAYPWEHYAPHYDAATVESLCLALVRLQKIKELRSLCERLSKTITELSWLSFWSGYSTYHFGKTRQSLDHFRRALDQGGLQRHHLLNMLPILLFEGLLDDSRRLLDQFPEKEDPEYLKMEVEYANQIGDAKGGLVFCEQLLALEPEHAPARFHQAVWFDELGQLEDARLALWPLLSHEDDEQQGYARLLLSGLFIKMEKYDEASQHIEALLPPQKAFELFQEDSWRRTFSINWGIILEHTGRSQEALEIFRQALAYPPKEPIYGHILDQLCEQQRFEEARELAHEAVADCPEEPRLKYALCQIEDYFEDWERCLELHEEIGLGWFREEDRLPQGIYLKMHALLGLGRPLDALEWCDELLPEILQHENLIALRKQLWNEVRAQFAHYQAERGAQQEQYQQLEETRRLLQRQREENRRRERAYQEILQKHQGVRQALALLGKAPHMQGLGLAGAPISEQVRATLPGHLQQILDSAQQLWQGLASDPTQDHGPVVLQIARVLEGQINRSLIDPLCAWVLAHDRSFGELPRPAVGALKPSRNRLSLGDSAHLLYHHMEFPESDGTTTVLVNTRSSSAHKEILEAFWSSEPWSSLPEELVAYLRDRLPRDLLSLAKARNQAGHARHPITRDAVGPLRILVLGNAKNTGILERLAAVLERLHEKNPAPV